MREIKIYFDVIALPNFKKKIHLHYDERKQALLPSFVFAFAIKHLRVDCLQSIVYVHQNFPKVVVHVIIICQFE